MSKICPKCGCVNENDNARFCNDCGEKFEVLIKEPVLKEVSEASFDKPEKITLTEIAEAPETNTPFVRNENVDTPNTPPVAATEPHAEVVRPKAVQKPVVTPQPSSGPFYEDDDDDYSEKPTEEIFEEVQNEDEDETYYSEPSGQPFIQNTSDLSEITNDPYYDDVLPEINNEIKAIPKDIIIKGIAVFFIIIGLGIYLISIW